MATSTSFWTWEAQASALARVWKGFVTVNSAIQLVGCEGITSIAPLLKEPPMSVMRGPLACTMVASLQRRSVVQLA